MREILQYSENLRDFLERPLLKIREGYIGESDELTPLSASIGIISTSGGDNLWLLKSVSLSRSLNQNTSYRVHNIFGNNYVLRSDLCDVFVGRPMPQTSYYEFESDDDALLYLQQIREGKKSISIS